MTSTVLIVTGCLGLAAALTLGGITMLNHWWGPRRRRREPAETEPPRAATTTNQPARHRRLRLPVLPLRRVPGQQHSGATEEYGAELRALRDVAVSPELAPVLTVEQIGAQVHGDLAPVGVAIDEFLDHIAAALKEFTGPLPARTCMILEAASWPTGEVDLVALQALLDADEREATTT